MIKLISHKIASSNNETLTQASYIHYPWCQGTPSSFAFTFKRLRPDLRQLTTRIPSVRRSKWRCSTGLGKTVPTWAVILELNERGCIYNLWIAYSSKDVLEWDTTQCLLFNSKLFHHKKWCKFKGWFTLHHSNQVMIIHRRVARNSACYNGGPPQSCTTHLRFMKALEWMKIPGNHWTVAGFPSFTGDDHSQVTWIAVVAFLGYRALHLSLASKGLPVPGSFYIEGKHDTIRNMLLRIGKRMGIPKMEDGI